MNNVIGTITIIAVLGCTCSCIFKDHSANSNVVPEPTERSADSNCTKIDSFEFRTARKIYSHKGFRLFPNPCLTDSQAILQIIRGNIYSIIESGDTVFVFMNLDMFGRKNNAYFPLVNDSTIDSFYRNYYNVNFFDTPPYGFNFESELDKMSFYVNNLDHKGEELKWVNASIRDTIFQIRPGIRVGIDAMDFFRNIGKEEFKYNRDDFIVILVHATMPREIWYRDYLCTQSSAKSTMQLFREKFDCKMKKGAFQILFEFEESVIKHILIDQQVGYR